MSSEYQPKPRGRGRARPRIRQAGNDSPTLITTMPSGDQPTPRGRGRARPRIRQARNDSPTRPVRFGPGSSSSDNVVVQGSGTPPYPEVTARMGEIALQHPGKSSETLVPLVPDVNPDGKYLRGASRGLRFDKDGDLIQNDLEVAEGSDPPLYPDVTARMGEIAIQHGWDQWDWTLDNENTRGSFKGRPYRYGR